jgi:lathosterol oxidase
MDIALELCDKYIFDHIFAALLPAANVSYGLDNASMNSTLLELSASSTWQYAPATKFFSFQPGEAAYLSQWNRDNIYRQFISLYFITWLVASYSPLSSIFNSTPGLPARQYTSL